MRVDDDSMIVGDPECDGTMKLFYLRRELLVSTRLVEVNFELFYFIIIIIVADETGNKIIVIDGVIHSRSFNAFLCVIFVFRKIEIERMKREPNTKKTCCSQSIRCCVARLKTGSSPIKIVS